MSHCPPPATFSSSPPAAAQPALLPPPEQQQPARPPTTRTSLSSLQLHHLLLQVQLQAQLNAQLQGQLKQQLAFQQQNLRMSVPLPSRLQKENPVSANTFSPDSPTQHLTAPTPTFSFQPTTPTSTTTNPSQQRKRKIQKYRAKRSKRNYDRPVDAVRSKIAQARKRDNKGHFLPNPKHARNDSTLPSSLRLKLESSEEECRKLRDHLLAKEAELERLKRQLHAQVMVNMNQESRLRRLEQTFSTSSSSPPPSPMEIGTPPNGDKGVGLGGPPTHIYNPPHPGNLLVPAFATKVDLSRINLKRNDTPPDYLQQARSEYFESLRLREEEREALMSEFGSEHPFLVGATDSAPFPTTASWEKKSGEKSPVSCSPPSFDFSEHPQIPTPTALIWRAALSEDSDLLGLLPS